MRGPQAPPEPKSVLVIAVPGFGDVLLCTPLIRAVRRAWPDTTLHVFLRGHVGGVLEGNTDVDEIIESTKHVTFHEVLAMLRTRFRSYDLVLSNSASDRMALYALLFGRRRISIVPPHGNGIPWKDWLYHKHVAVDEHNWHILTRVNKLGELAGIEPHQYVTIPRSPGSREVLCELLGSDWETQRFAVVHPAASVPAKQWRAKGWRTVVKYLDDAGLRVIVTGGPGQVERRYVIDELGFVGGSVTNLVGRLRLGDISELLGRCAVYVGVDTLVSHIASSAGAPTVVMFGPTNPVKWGPWPLHHQAPISPYARDGSQRVGNVFLVNGMDESLANLASSEVLNAVETMLDSAAMREHL